MSAGYILHEAAQQDLEEIWFYTFQKWDAEQADKYIRELISRFEWLAANPALGLKRDEIKSGYYSFPQGSHRVFYTVSNDHINIIGVPHQSMDIERYFQD